MSSEDRCSYCLPHMRKPIQEASSYCMPYRIRPLGVKVFSLCFRNLQVLILFTSQDSCTQAVHLTGKVILLFRQSCINDVHSTFMCLTNLEDLILYISQERSTQHKSSRNLHHRGPLRRSFPYRFHHKIHFIMSFHAASFFQLPKISHVKKRH